MEPRMDMTSFLARINKRQRELAEMAGVKTATVGGWCTGRIFPAYDKIAKLLELGMTIEELFGKDVADKVVIFRNPVELKDPQAQYSASLDMNNPAVKSALEQAFKDMLLNTAKSIGDKR